MPFEPGKPKTGGREKGTPNKSTQHVIEMAEAMGCDPIQFLISVIIGDVAVLKEAPDLDQRIGAAKEVASYLYPKRKAIEHTGKDGQELKSLEDVIRDAIKK